MLLNINLENKCGSCCHFKAIGGTTQGECLQNPYGEDVVHDPEHPYWIVQRSRIKCRLYNIKPQTNADRIRAMSDEELAVFLADEIPHGDCYGCNLNCIHNDRGNFEDSCQNTWYGWLKQPAEGE